MNLISSTNVKNHLSHLPYKAGAEMALPFFMSKTKRFNGFYEPYCPVNSYFPALKMKLSHLVSLKKITILNTTSFSDGKAPSIVFLPPI